MHRYIAPLVVLVLLFSSVPERAPAAGTAAQSVVAQDTNKINQDVQKVLLKLKPGDMVSVIISLKEQLPLNQPPLPNQAAQRAHLVRSLRLLANKSQADLIKLLKERHSAGSVERFTSFWIFNGLSVNASSDVIQELAVHPDVYSIRLNRAIPGPSNVAVPVTASAAPAFNLSMLHVPSLWDLGYRGQGVVVANLDTGVSLDHPALHDQWRGGTNSWYDPYQEHPARPTDLNGHGTWTMGVMVGKEMNGMVVGLAPEAKWIAARIFNDQNQATVEAIHMAYQWILDPDGNPDTNDAPNIVNNSWSFQLTGCFLEFQPDLQALRAANILPIFAAGNFGPGETTSVSPANYPEAFAVGAIDGGTTIAALSSRGYSNCGESDTTFPEIVAPGVDIMSTSLHGAYAYSTGTSLAAPHAAGALALLLSAYPNMSAKEQQAVLIEAASDLGDAGPDNTYGYGRMDVLDAYLTLSGSPLLPDTGGQSLIKIYIPLTANGQ